MSEERTTTQPSASHDAMPHDPIVIAAMFTATIWRERGVVVDPELICTLLNRFHLSQLSTTQS